eukprot:1159962-Pelagomonas_calceolata.AAC.11
MQQRTSSLKADGLTCECTVSCSSLLCFPSALLCSDCALRAHTQTHDTYTGCQLPLASFSLPKDRLLYTATLAPGHLKGVDNVINNNQKV